MTTMPKARLPASRLLANLAGAAPARKVGSMYILKYQIKMEKLVATEISASNSHFVICMRNILGIEARMPMNRALVHMTAFDTRNVRMFLDIYNCLLV